MNVSRLPLLSLPSRLLDTAILLIAATVRFWQLDYHSVWFDESVSLKWARADIAYTWTTTFQLVQDKHPPVYYVMLGLWQSLLSAFGLGQNDAALRALGAVLGILTVWGMLRLATEASGRSTGLLAALLVALSPILTWYSQELRMFQPATTGIVWGALALLMAWKTPAAGKRLAWWLLMLVAVEAALYSYLFSAFILPPLGLTLLYLFWRERKLRRFIEGCVALLVVALLFLPLALNAWSVNDAESTPGQSFENFFGNLWRLLQVDTIWRVDWPTIWLTSTLILFAALIALALTLPMRAPSANDHGRAWLWLWIGLPLLIANILLARSHSIFAEDRYLVFIVPFVLWAVARGIVALASWAPPVGWTAGTLASLALLLALPLLWTPPRTRENWRSASDYIAGYTAANPNVPAAVVTHIDYTHEALEWYLRQRYTHDELPVFFPFGGTLTEADIDNVIAPPLNGIVEYGAHTLWLTQSHLEGVDDARLVERWLAQHFPVITEQYPAGVKLTGYILQGRLDELPPLGPNGRMIDSELVPGLRLAACEITTPVVSARDDFMHPPSGWVHLRLWWQATAPLNEDYLAGAKVVGPEGVWGDKLGRETESLRFWPTGSWTAGEYVRDEIDINLNPLTPPRTYPVIVGLLNNAAQPVGNSVECATVQIR